jgi:hypothetical protein
MFPTRDVTGRTSELFRRAFLAATGGALAGAAALGLAGRADADEPKPGRGGTLRIATRSDAIGLDSHRNLMYYVSFPIAYTTQGLLDLNLKLEPSTGIATEWEASKDLLTIPSNCARGCSSTTAARWMLPR